MSIHLNPRYLIRRSLGVGGAGHIFHVYDKIRDLELALKVVAPGEAKWLKREFGTLRSVRHENLVQVYDWETLPDQSAFYTMELVEGADWGAREFQQQSASEVLRILAGVLRGLAHLHSHSEVHGDLKPGNVLLSNAGAVKVGDVGMGVGRQAGMLSMTTPGYTAPEVWEGSDPDVRADIYSCAVMAYEALVGKHPFSARTVREVVSGQLEGWVPSPSAHGVHLSAQVERALMRAIDRNPNLRPGSADEFMTGLGIEERIGEVLGGAIVGRENEVAAIEALITRQGSDDATLIHLVGPSGSGKTALLEEVANNVSGRGVRALFLFGSDISLSSLVRAITGKELSPSGTPEGNLLIASELIGEVTRDAPVFVWLEECPSRFVDEVRGLTRWLWATYLDSNAYRLTVAVTGTETPSKLESFERVLHLAPLNRLLVEKQLEALLGSVESGSALVAWLHDASGGLPGTLVYLVKALVREGVVSRERGTWVLRNTNELSSLRISGSDDRWESAWEALTGQCKDLLSAIALLSRGLNEAQLRSLIGPLPDSVLRSLESQGWLRQVSGSWLVASEGIQRTLLSKGATRTPELARLIRSALWDQLNREERAALAVLHERSLDALTECIWAAERLEERGDVRRAATMYEAAITLSNELGDQVMVETVALKYAQTLFQLGELSKAEAALSQICTTKHPELMLLLGRIQIGKGEVANARAALQGAVVLAERVGNSRLHLRCQAELSELEWRYGSDQSRREAIEVSQRILESLKHADGLPDEKAALAYGIGSALVVGGEPQRAKAILESGFAKTVSDTWKAKLANALGAASGVRGENDVALSWYDVAWEYVERAKLVSLKARILANRGAIYYAMGDLQNAVSLNRQAAGWARRLGNPFEYMAACAGTAIGLIYMGCYEEAVQEARESARCARELEDDLDRIKGLELEALACFHLGAFTEARALVRDALEISARLGGTRLTGRVLWLQGRLEAAVGELQLAISCYESAEREIAELDDLEDLLGVQIELEALRVKPSEESERVLFISALAERGETAGLTVVHLNGVLTIAEILGRFNLDHRTRAGLFWRAFERAEACGFYDVAWRLSYWLAEFALRDGDLKLARSRYSHAIRMIRGIADRLSPDYRATYLKGPHVTAVLQSGLAS
jgi:eukaryotic-like serine/threonine-protein kinase